MWTVPNLLSALRLAGVPVFLWLVLGPEEDGWALALLMFSGITDFLDGWLARKLNQQSVVGQILDPVADRLYILAVVVGLALRDIIPWWMAISLPLRDLLMWGLVPILRTRGYSSLPVHFLGKAATFNLLYAFPLLLLGDGEGVIADPGPGLRLGVRTLGDRALLVGRRPLRLAGAQADRDHRAPLERCPMPDAATRGCTMPLLTLITQQSLDEDYQIAAERRALGRAALRGVRRRDGRGGRGDRGVRGPGVHGLRPEQPAARTSRTPAATR